MNILLINNLYGKDSVGGAEQIVTARAKRFTAEGNQVFVISSTDEVLKEQENDGISITTVVPKNLCWYKELPGKSLFFRIVWHIFNYADKRTSRTIVNYCRKHKIDRVETHNLIGISMQVPRALRKAGIEHHHYLHDVQLVEPSGILPVNHTKDSLFQRIYSLYIQKAFGSPDVVISPTKFLSAFYVERGFFPESTWRIETENLVEKNILKLQSREDAIQGKTYLFIGGSLVKHKGVIQLLAAWKNKTHEKGERLIIVGDGPLRDMVETAAITDVSIDYRGRISHEKIGKVYEEADVLVFPSQCIENRPNVIAEAMAHGLDIIAVNTGGVAEMVEGYGKCVFVSPDNLVL